MSADHSARLAAARNAASAAGVDAVLVTPGADLRYLTGYDAVALERLTCLVLPATGDPTLLVPALEAPAAAASPVGELGLTVRSWEETEDPYPVVAELAGRGAERVAVDNRMWAEKVLRLRAVLPAAEQEPAGSILGPLRMRKSAGEVAELRRAGAAIDRVHAAMGDWLRTGRTEREVGRDIAAAIVAAGHVRADFVIVGSGPHSASPHAELTDRVVEPGDPVVVDIGGTTAAGYCSDSTRTYVVGGPPPAELAGYYEVLRAAQDAACAHVAPGLTASSVDAAARRPIADAGFGDAFLHRTGHGIGLETHEPPYIVAGNDVALAPGMAFSVEPGIYLGGRHGARIEDIVVVTDDGGERLNERPRHLAELSG